MDGAYITSTKKADILNLLTLVYNNLIMALINEDNFFYWYMVRCSIAHGPIIHGKDIPYAASTEFSSRVGYKEQLLIGPAMIEAYNNERNAAPMGIFLCNSVSNTRINSSWKWFDNPNTKTPQRDLQAFRSRFEEYLTWLDNHSSEEEYPKESRRRHINAAYDYFQMTHPD